MGLLDNIGGLVGGMGGQNQQNQQYPQDQQYQQQNQQYQQQNQPQQQYQPPAGASVFTVLNELYCKAYVQSPRAEVFTKAGAMVAYKGNVKFEKVILGPQGNPLSAAMGQIGRRLTGENMPLMKCKGSGEVILANLSEHVTVINLSEGVCVESENLLAFTETCKYGFKFLAQGAISQKGLFTSTLSPNGPNAWVAILTDGNPLVINTPCHVDPDALVAWTGPDPRIKLDIGWRNLVGQNSGETYNFEFGQAGHHVIIQPTERKSGLDISVDGRRTGSRPDVQHNQSLGQAAGGIGGALGGLFGGGNSGGGGGLF
ncbi:AIM24 family protein [Lachnospiraceae bacterium ZAX-1]